MMRRRLPALFAMLVSASLLLVACATQPGAGADATASAQPAELVLVAGASGRAGHFVVAQLRAQGAAFRPLTRSRADALERLGPAYADLDWVECDVRDPAQVATAMRGVTHVISVIGANQIGGPNSAEFVDYGGVKNLVDAALAAKVRHFVLLTAIGVTDPAHPFNKATKGALGWRLKGEDYLRASGIDYTIVRPGGLVNQPAGQQGLRIEQGDNWRPLLRSTLSREDLALVLIEALHNPAARRATFELVNDPAAAPGAWRAAFSGLRPDP
ncbi:MAG: SDR family oxidoreductase [Gammaproteobacteria bacterium]|nr:SDR family oxidoreductase [Gammaproteobacteria bacterium]